MRKGFYVLYSATIGALAYATLAWMLSSDPKVASEPVSCPECTEEKEYTNNALLYSRDTTSGSLPVTAEQIEEFRRELMALGEQIRSVKDEQAMLRQRLTDISLSELENSEPQMLEEDREFGHLEASTEDMAIAQIEALSDSFSHEPIDSSWSMEAESGLETAISKLDLAGATSLYTNCHSTMCRVEIEFEDAESRDQAIETLAFPLQGTGEAFFHAGETDPLYAVMYIAREGETLPDY